MEVAIIKEKIEKGDFQKMLVLAERDLETLQTANFDDMKALYNSVKARFERALTLPKDDPDYLDRSLYKGEDIGKVDVEFFARVDPFFVQDMITNA